MEFQPEKESWDLYTERLDHFFKAAGIEDDDKKVFTLIHQNGPSLYTLLKELSFPKNPTQLSYDDITDILKRHYVGAKSVFYERKAFFAAQLKPFESATEWHRRLKALVISCEFGGFIENVLVDKFITGFQGNVLHRLYELDENTSLQRALEIAQRYENDSITVDNSKDHQGRMSSEKVQKQQQPRRQQGNRTKQKQETNQQEYQKAHTAVSPQQSMPPQMIQKQQINQNVVTCFKCGKKGHYANVCRSGSRTQRHSEGEQKAECCIS